MKLKNKSSEYFQNKLIIKTINELQVKIFYRIYLNPKRSGCKRFLKSDSSLRFVLFLLIRLIN